MKELSKFGTKNHALFNLLRYFLLSLIHESKFNFLKMMQKISEDVIFICKMLFYMCFTSNKHFILYLHLTDSIFHQTYKPF